MQFPTFFRLRIIGWNEADFPDFILERLLPFIPELLAENLELRPSGGGKYLAVHVTFFAESRSHLDSIYADLSTQERVLWIL
jgi:putative lipoic acid-binding regulatory protein